MAEEDLTCSYLKNDFLLNASDILNSSPDLMKLRSNLRLQYVRSSLAQQSAWKLTNCCVHCCSSMQQAVLKVKPIPKPKKSVKNYLDKLESGENVHPIKAKFLNKCRFQNTAVYTCVMCHEKMTMPMKKSFKKNEPVEVVTINETTVKKKKKKKKKKGKKISIITLDDTSATLKTDQWSLRQMERKKLKKHKTMNEQKASNAVLKTKKRIGTLFNKLFQQSQQPAIKSSSLKAFLSSTT